MGKEQTGRNKQHATKKPVGQYRNQRVIQKIPQDK